MGVSEQFWRNIIAVESHDIESGLKSHQIFQLAPLAAADTALLNTDRPNFSNSQGCLAFIFCSSCYFVFLQDQTFASSD